MATEADLIQKFKDLNIPVGADFEELIHAAFAGANLADLVNNYDSRITTVENDLSTAKDSIQSNTDNKVTDNHDGTEQLNGVQVHPYNKLSDTIGGRNLLINTAQLNDSTVCLDNLANTSDTYLGLNVYQTTGGWKGVRIYLSYLASKIKTDTDYVMSEYVRNTSPTTSVPIYIFGNNSTGVVFNSPINYNVVTLPPNSGWTRISALVNIASFSTTVSGTVRFEASNATDLTDGYVQFAGLKLEQGSIATDWTPAPEDKADDSKVVHNSGNEEIGGQKTFDTAPIDKTTGNPYSTKSDIATAINAATANMADDSKVVHRDPSTGVVSASTTFSDLKVGNGQQVASIDVASSEQEATDKASKFTAPGIVIY